MPHEGKRGEQMALSEKQMMKEDEGDRGGENHTAARSSGLEEKLSALFVNGGHIFKLENDVQWSSHLHQGQTAP